MVTFKKAYLSGRQIDDYILYSDIADDGLADCDNRACLFSPSYNEGNVLPSAISSDEQPRNIWHHLLTSGC